MPLSEKTFLGKYNSQIDQLESLNGEIRSSEDAKSTTGLQRRIATITHWIGDFESVAGIIADTLGFQREHQKHLGLKKFHNIAEHKQRETMEKQSPSLFYYAQRAFSLPADYVFLPEDFVKNRGAYISAIVIQPELLSDDLLIALGLMNEDERLPSLGKKNNQEKSLILKKNIEKKIQCIPQFKEILSGIHSFQTGVGSRKTGRINQLPFPYEGYLVFQEQKIGTAERRKSKILHIAKIYTNMYSLLRSQMYGRIGMEQELVNLGNISTLLGHLYYGWKIDSIDSKKKQISEILDLIGDSHNPHKMSARKRLLAIQFKHDENDANRVLGAMNDIRKQVYVQGGKKGSIGHQGALLQHDLREEEAKFDFLKINFIQVLKKMDTPMLMLYIGGNMKVDDKLLTSLEGVYATLRNIVASGQKSTFIGEPFSRFTSKLAHESTSHQKSPLEDIRGLLRIVLAIKIQSYTLFLYQTKHSLKLTDNTENIRKDIRDLKNLLEEKTFLPEIELKDQGIQRFESMLAILAKLDDVLLSGDKEQALALIDNLIGEL